MPTYDVTNSFRRDVDRLTKVQRTALNKAIKAFVKDPGKGRFRKGLRVKGIQGAPGIFETTWADDGRCTFEYGPEVRPGEPHIIWRRCGTHQVLSGPDRGPGSRRAGYDGR